MTRVVQAGEGEGEDNRRPSNAGGDAYAHEDAGPDHRAQAHHRRSAYAEVPLQLLRWCAGHRPPALRSKGEEGPMSFDQRSWPSSLENAIWQPLDTSLMTSTKPSAFTAIC